jgi:hypothetical protein
MQARTPAPQHEKGETCSVVVQEEARESNGTATFQNAKTAEIAHGAERFRVTYYAEARSEENHNVKDGWAAFDLWHFLHLSGANAGDTE